ncbi:thymidine kinase [Turkeypox virus]|uniref:Thymidine kinase n=1 Tax=Turkeypox virus TaxID=336486 RepID=A0A0M3ZRN5_9POXV|nr:thymidine kinase [Turkeypox virus]ALA62434.1 thymidine kinase [Turkeypox virus]
MPNSTEMFLGSIHLILGPMFSGKTTELIRRMKRFNISNLRCVIIKHSSDNRYTDNEYIVYTHDNINISAVSTDMLMPLIQKIKNVDVIGIDEGQFFCDISEFCELMANNGKIIVVAALNGDFKRELFGNIFKLLPIAESISMLTAVCMKCYKDASFSKRVTDDTRVKLIGGKETYMAVCRTCFFQN